MHANQIQYIRVLHIIKVHPHSPRATTTTIQLHHLKNLLRKSVNTFFSLALRKLSRQPSRPAATADLLLRLIIPTFH